jgi:hypothetical protein
MKNKFLKQTKAFPLLPAMLAAGALLVLPGMNGSRLTSDDLLNEITGNTLTGYHNGGVKFTEYHAPDGKIFGFNNGEAVDGGCWRVRDESICYYYPKGSITGDFCWRYARAGAEGYQIEHTQSESRGFVRLKKGNPDQLTDMGKSWTCDALLSNKGLKRRFARW